MDTATLIALLAAGLAGGNAAALTFQDKSLGFVLNSLSGVVGGLLGAGALAFSLGSSSAGLIQHVAGAGTGGAVLMLLVGLVRHRRRD